MRFRRVPAEQWRFDESVPANRQRRLLDAPSYEEIVARLRYRLVVERVSCQPIKSGEGAYRIVVKLRCTPQAVDLFHNASNGYRAQYWFSDKLGDAANRFALEELLPDVLPRILDRRLTSLTLSVLETSLSSAAAKVWINQGLWLRRARRDDRVLRVPRWQSELVSDDKRRSKLARWACLIPRREPCVMLKGGFVFLDGSPLGGFPSKNRAEELYYCGFT